MQLPVSVLLKTSRLLAALLAFAHALAAAAVLATGLPWPLRALLLAASAASLLRILLRLREPPAASLHLGSKGEIEIETKVGARETARILPGSLVLPGLIVLALQWDGRRRTLTILPDAVGRDAHRRLRVWLKWRASFG